MRRSNVLLHGLIGGLVSTAIMVFHPLVQFPTEVGEVPVYLAYALVPGLLVGLGSGLIGAGKASTVVGAILIGITFPFGILIGIALTGKFDDPPTIVDNVIIYAIGIIPALVLGLLPALLQRRIRKDALQC